MDPKKLAGIINTSSGRCWSSDTYNPCPGVIVRALPISPFDVASELWCRVILQPTAPSSRAYEGGFGSDLMKKDIGSLARALLSSALCSCRCWSLSYARHASPLFLTHAGLAVDAAAGIQLPLPLGQRALELYEELSKAGLGKKDFSVVFQYLSQLQEQQAKAAGKK